MPVTFTFDAAPTGMFNSYEEDGFRITSGLINAPDAFAGGEVAGDLGTGAYVLARYTGDIVMAEKIDGGSFGALSLSLDGFRWTGFDAAGAPVAGGSANQIEIVGYRNDGAVLVHTLTTDDQLGFETFALPEGFGAGLLFLQWRAVDGSGLLLMDDLVLQENRAPDAVDFTGSGAADGLLGGALVGTDPDGQALTFTAVGELPVGVSLDPDGAFWVEAQEADLDLAQGQSRTITFDFQVSDGEAVSAVRTATFVIQGVTAPGVVLTGSAGSDQLTGDSGPDTLAGAGGDDVLSGGRGADLLQGEAGADSLFGDGGDDRLEGGGEDDVLDGGVGSDTLAGGLGVDLFVFTWGSGEEVIADFQPDVVELQLDEFGAEIEVVLSQGDQIRFDLSMFQADSTFEGVMSHAVQAGADVVFTYSGDDGLEHTLTLVGVELGALRADDFLFG